MSFRDLKSYQSAVIIHDFTVEFVERYIDSKSRTKDQMEQAARSGKQNIVEGVEQKTSSKNELKLLGVARASFAELLEDYHDFLRQRGLLLWERDSLEAKAVRNLVYQNKSCGTYKSDKSYQPYRVYLSDPATAGNAMVCTINQCNYLLDRQIRALEEKYATGDSWEDKMKQKKEEEKKKQIWSSWSQNL
ncbi:MAG: hypothetical protein A3H57_03175 [Candidatus Taylorbacteria bacterium RIFCSPLOWO2_02_FULL_43_11]|uniref:Four helix bundle protein n=1 Tax=Candidatus Taylorbacteria bacterium RIFCSPHIGHO2_02_FULL_43_32b TaxID=1802306 RepID=A0A1G2MI62_9BACT|nr:MAG: hypothetical protein A2743_00905 [Candidatus Taylorbacteria bacterium RIFCSPHIGHO2_01_FULL_43_47]OHA22682.1 MAG: hypothetical protein A3C72_01330 [Candidatus Taylorbacteria bacterium RIFCSPHIGHO2_02_FULL_43_32b]OHA29642.1 MAG: hypothetical protein A3B08_03435 [Candidatus Taylorbacteria bacterium RIFCSPLOWO2_01_FULL_43_44]OHA36107.1 MAG: hypothetical protein A3H57_03175 [Candidatus Taylorbacteria bacterium RIFCSPLOWO2_02_FULL_43_11]